MKIYRNFDAPAGLFTACIGFFDGVHRGHRFLLDHLRRVADGRMPTAVITFANHPRRLVQPDYDLRLIDTLGERLSKLERTGVDVCFLLDFTEALRSMTAEQFLRDVLARRMHVARLIIGYDHRFGRNRSEGFDDYVRYGAACGIEVLPAPELIGGAESPSVPPLGTTDGMTAGEGHISSSAVRRALAVGDVERAAWMLGEPYRLEGLVVPGHRLGRRLGFPTANLDVPAEKVIPATGVYAAMVRLDDGAVWPAMLNVGYRPTVDSASTRITLEAHLIGYEGNLYGRRLALSLIRRIRDERRMPSLEALQAQLAADRDAVAAAIGEVR